MGRLLEAVKDGTKLDVLVALRDETARAIESTTSGRDVAALSKRLIEICELIEGLPDENSQDPVDQMISEVADFYSDD